MKTFLYFIISILAVAFIQAQTVSVGNFVCNPGARFVVPIELDDATGLAFASVTVNYDSTLLVLTDVRQGNLESIFDRDFIVTETLGSVLIITFGRQNATGGKGTIAELVFQARDGSAALYSDITIADVTLREKTVTKDLTIDRPIVPKSGMLRSYAHDATCTNRLVEGSLTVAPETKLAHLSLVAGDALCVSDTQKPIEISSTLTVDGTLKLIAPENGWATATYEILKAPEAGISFDVEGLPEGSELRETTDNGVTLYTLSVAIDNEIPISAEMNLLPADQNAIRALLEDELENVSTIEVKGSEEAVLAGIDLGIRPLTRLEDGVLTATFALPKLTVVAFDPQTGLVKMRVEPSDGGTIKGTIATGVLHLYGTETLSMPMTEVASENVEIDLTAYQNESTRGEVSFVVQLGRYTFVKVVVGRTTTSSTTNGE